MTRRFCFALDLKDDPELIAEYRKYHEKIWPEITESIRKSGIEDMKIAGKGAEIAGYSISHEQKKKAAPIVHYGFGAAVGALYGTLTELGPHGVRRHPVLSGMGFGSVLFAGADEVAVPSLGLSAAPGETPVSSHIYALASHLIYGATAGAVRRIV